MSELPSIKLKFITATGDFDEDEYVLKSYAEAALAAKDARIKELEDGLKAIISLGNPWCSDIAYATLEAKE